MYGIVEERLYLEEAGCYRTYGIRTVSGRLISDVCTERERLSAFVDELNAAVKVLADKPAKRWDGLVDKLVYAAALAVMAWIAAGMPGLN